MQSKSDISKIKDASGALYVETALCLPILFLAAFGLIQLAHIAFAWEIVHYASFASARSVLVANPKYKLPGSFMNEEQAAALGTASRICPFRSENSSVSLDAQGRCRKGCTAVTVEQLPEDPDARLVTVFMDVPVLFNLRFLRWGGADFFISSPDYDTPHLRLRESTLISKRVCPATKNNLPGGLDR